MEEVKYIPGDLVMIDGLPIGTKKGVAYVVTASGTNRTLTLKDGTINKGVATLDAVTKEDKENFVETSTWVKHIVPIPITSEILEKNGWKKKVMSRGILNSHWVYTKPDIEEYGYFPIYIEKGIGKEFDVYPFTYNKSCTQITYIKYVHELQHLLFGLGINHEMEV